MYPFEYFPSCKYFYNCDFLNRTVSDYVTRYNLPSSISQSTLIALVRSAVPRMSSKLLRNGTALAILLDSWDCTPQIICVENHPLILSPPTELPTASFVFHLVFLRPHFCSWRHLLSLFREKWSPFPFLSPENRPHFLSTFW